MGSALEKCVLFSRVSLEGRNGPTSNACFPPIERGVIASPRDGDDGTSTLTSEERADPNRVFVVSVCRASDAANLRSNSSR